MPNNKNEKLDQTIDQLIRVLDHFVNTNLGNAKLQLREAIKDVITVVVETSRLENKSQKRRKVTL